MLIKQRRGTGVSSCLDHIRSSVPVHVLRRWNPAVNEREAAVFYHILKDPSQARLCYCFDLKFAIKLLVERDKTSTVQLVKI